MKPTSGIELMLPELNPAQLNYVNHFIETCVEEGQLDIIEHLRSSCQTYPQVLQVLDEMEAQTRKIGIAITTD